MLLYNLNCLVLAASLGAKAHANVALPAEVSVARDTMAAVDTTPVVLTSDLFKRLNSFLSYYQKESGTVKDSAATYLSPANLQFGPISGMSQSLHAQAVTLIESMNFTLPDYVAIAATFPSVAADIHRAGLRPQQVRMLAETICSAIVTDVGDLFMHSGKPGSADKSTVIGRNVIFVRAHQKEVDAIGWLPPIDQMVAAVQQQFGGDDADSSDTAP